MLMMGVRMGTACGARYARHNLSIPGFAVRLAGLPTSNPPQG